MKTITMNKDQFAQFMADVIRDIDSYKFDVLYDIAKIISKLSQSRGETEYPVREELHLMLRSTGCDLITPDDENYKVYDSRATKVYKLLFCWNESYFSNTMTFCIAERIK